MNILHSFTHLLGVERRKMSTLFNLDSYYHNLKTRTLGRPCVYLDRVETTIEVAAPKDHGTLVLAREQTKGRGQRTNIWHSPIGCAMGSLKIVCSKISPIASRLCFLQHIMALVAAKTLEQVDDKKLSKNYIRLKWPNDIVYISPNDGSIMKIGGILVNSVEKNNEFDVTLSFGLNILNREPTICIADIVNNNHSTESIRIDAIVATMMNNLETFIDQMNDENFQELKRDYTERCIQINKMIEDENHGRVKIREVNDDGFLVGERCIDQKFCTVTRIVS